METVICKKKIRHIRQIRVQKTKKLACLMIKRTRISLIERIMETVICKKKIRQIRQIRVQKNKKLAWLMIKRTRISLIERIGCALKRFLRPFGSKRPEVERGRFDRFVFRIIRALCNLIGASGRQKPFVFSSQRFRKLLFLHIFEAFLRKIRKKCLKLVISRKIQAISRKNIMFF